MMKILISNAKDVRKFQMQTVEMMMKADAERSAVNDTIINLLERFLYQGE